MKTLITRATYKQSFFFEKKYLGNIAVPNENTLSYFNDFSQRQDILNRLNFLRTVGVQSMKRKMFCSFSSFAGTLQTLCENFSIYSYYFFSLSEWTKETVVEAVLFIKERYL